MNNLIVLNEIRKYIAAGKPLALAFDPVPAHEAAMNEFIENWGSDNLLASVARIKGVKEEELDVIKMHILAVNDAAAERASNAKFA